MAWEAIKFGSISMRQSVSQQASKRASEQVKRQVAMNA